MATKGLVGGVNSSTSTVTASGSIPTAVTASISNSGAVNGSIRSSNSTVSAGAVSNTLVPVEYVGVESESLYITVDNNNRTITGSVKWRNMIANTEAEEQQSTFAYPANKAYINFRNIQDDILTLENSIELLEDSCNNTVNVVSTYSSKVDEFKSAFESYRSLCQDHSKKIQEEASARQRLELSYKQADAMLRSDLEREISVIDNKVADALSTQTTTRDNLQSALDSEISRAKIEEDTIRKTVSSNSGNITVLKNSFGKLSNTVDKIDNRVVHLESLPIVTFMEDTRNSLDSISSRVGNIDLRLTGRTTALSEDISILKTVVYTDRTRLGDLETQFSSALQKSEGISETVTNNSSSLHDLQLQLNNQKDLRDDQIALLSSQLSSESALRQDSDAFHSAELSRLNQRISKLYVEFGESLQDTKDEFRQKDAELYNELHNVNYTFIDGGTAPV